MQLSERPNTEAAILRRLIGPEDPPLSREAIEGILSLGFKTADKVRMRQLSAKSRAGTLTRKERAEIEAYSRVGSMLGILKSRARRAGRRSNSNGRHKSH
jgi:hypothetical protein